MGRTRIAMWAVLVAAALSSSWAFRHRPAPPGLPDPEFDDKLIHEAYGRRFMCGYWYVGMVSLVERNPGRAAWYLRHGNSDERHVVATGFSFWEYPLGGEVAIPALQESLQDPDEYVRSCAARALGHFGSVARDSVAKRAAMASDASPGVRAAAVASLGSVAEDAASAVPALVSALRDSDSSVRYSAVKSLGRLGPRAAVAIPELLLLLDDPAGYVCSIVPGALAAADPQGTRVVGPLVSRLKAIDRTRATAASVTALASIGRPAIPALIRELKSGTPLARSHAAEALGIIGSSAREAVPALAEALSSGYLPLREQAIAALAAMGADAVDAIPALEAAKSDPLIAKAAAEAIGKIRAAQRSR